MLLVWSFRVQASRASKWVGCFPFDLLWCGLYKIGVFSYLEFLFRIQYVHVDWKGELSTVQFLKQFSFLFLLGLVCCTVSSKAPASQPCNGWSGWRLSPPSCECGILGFGIPGWQGLSYNVFKLLLPDLWHHCSREAHPQIAILVGNLSREFLRFPPYHNVSMSGVILFHVRRPAWPPSTGTVTVDVWVPCPHRSSAVLGLHPVDPSPFSFHPSALFSFLGFLLGSFSCSSILSSQVPFLPNAEVYAMSSSGDPLWVWGMSVQATCVCAVTLLL